MRIQVMVECWLDGKGLRKREGGCHGEMSRLIKRGKHVGLDCHGAVRERAVERRAWGGLDRSRYPKERQ